MVLASGHDDHLHVSLVDPEQEKRKGDSNELALFAWALSKGDNDPGRYQAGGMRGSLLEERLPFRVDGYCKS